MKIYTKKGDSGETSLIGGTRVPKHHIRIEAYGTTDELNSCLGLLADYPEMEAQRPFIRQIQSTLFSIGSHLANDSAHFKLPEIEEKSVQALEASIDEMDKVLPPLTNFVLPGGHPANSTAHIARCICRRAERNVVHLNEIVPVSPIILQYLNRLSDWLFTLSRFISLNAGVEEILWQPGK
ncbi:MAG: cob(I)yrinic acid a,c-diamide adenosyltransferase [Bacteroidia bacterium]|nr:cob(I)yrinic acid a,c-diamide adenosyltransferase [Bacteroidia bacterium]